MSSVSFFGKVNKKIKELRRSDQKTKRYWLIGSTIVVMVVVVILWVVYLNFTIPKVTQDEDNSEVVSNIEKSSENNSILFTLNRGFKKTVSGVSSTFKKFSQKISELITKTKDSLENVKEYTPSSN
jgi:amino acid permease